MDLYSQHPLRSVFPPFPSSLHPFFPSSLLTFLHSFVLLSLSIHEYRYSMLCWLPFKTNETTILGSVNNTYQGNITAIFGDPIAGSYAKTSEYVHKRICSDSS